MDSARPACEPLPDPNQPDPSVKPPVYDIVTEGWEPDKTVFMVRDKAATEKKD